MEAAKALTLKPFIPAKDFAISRQFYIDLGFSQDFESPDLVGFSLDSVSFLLQNFYDPALANNLLGAHSFIGQVSEADQIAG